MKIRIPVLLTNHSSLFLCLNGFDRSGCIEESLVSGLLRKADCMIDQLGVM